MHQHFFIHRQSVQIPPVLHSRCGAILKGNLSTGQLVSFPHLLWKNFEPQNSTRHCEERSDAPQGGFSCPFRAIHLLAIPSIFRAGELVLPSIHGIATPVCALARNDMVFLDEAPSHTLQNRFKISSPTFPLFSGWNWQPKTLPCSTAAVMGMP